MANRVSRSSGTGGKQCGEVAAVCIQTPPNDKYEWFGPARLAGLPGLPGTIRGVRKLADRRGWTRRSKQGQGGGYEYHISSLPAETRAALIFASRKQAPAAPAKPHVVRTGIWEEWERKPASIRDEAKRRLDAITAVHQLVADGEKKLEAYAIVAEQVGESITTVRTWLSRVKDAHPGDYLPLLAPRYTGRTAYAEYDERIYQWFRDQYLSPSRPSFTICYERVSRAAAAQGLTVPSLSTLKRDLERREDPVVVVLEREGEKRAAEKFPYLERDRSVFHAMQALNGDGHILDIDTTWPDGERCRTTLIGFQDLHSGKIVGYRLSKAESAHEIGLAFLNVCDEFGVCEHLWMDNTLAMASKRMTAGAKGRKRFRDKEGDPLGVLPMLGVQVHFTLTAHGQSKPIERAFRDLATRISKHPAFEGAYLGNNPVNKPANYGERSINVADVARIVEQEIIAHNAQPNRNTAVCARRLSFDQAFEQSYVTSADNIRRLTATQRRLLYLVADVVRVRQDGTVHLFRNRYHSELLLSMTGKQVVLRYHPTERMLHDAVYAYALNGDYIGEIACYHAAGFADADAAQTHNRKRKQFMRAKKDLAKAGRHLAAAEAAALAPAMEPPLLPGGIAAVVRGDFNTPTTLERLATIPPSETKKDRHAAAEERVSATLSQIGAAVDEKLRQKRIG